MTLEDKEGLESLMQHTLRKVTILKKRLQRLNNKEEINTLQTDSIVNAIEVLQEEIREYLQ